MTKLIVSSKNAEYFPVLFRVYHVENGKPMLPGVILTLHRFVGCRMDDPRFETVGATVKRLKEMLVESSARFSIMAAKETDEERAARYKRDDLEVVNETDEKAIINSMSTKLRRAEAA